MSRFVRSNVWQKGCWGGGASVGRPEANEIGARLGVGAVASSISENSIS